MAAQDMEELLLRSKIVIPPNGTKYLFLQILEEVNRLRKENPNFAFSRILASNFAWVSKAVRVLPNPGVKAKYKKLRVEMDEKVLGNEVVIEYYDVVEVEKFVSMIPDISP